ncbi:MAG: hypothetical protein QXM43_05680 [Desulfurococcaceae archaeon]
MKLREFKALSLAKLISIARQLREKYPDRRERVDYIVDILATKLQNLRTFTLTDYIFTVYQAAKEFKEFEELIPDPKVVEELLEEGE